jgi:uncharacterized RDD family membrane protein YckC
MDKYNTIGSRFVASIIDGIVMIPVGLLSGIIVFMQGFPKLAIVWNIVISLIPVIYTIWLHTVYGQTLGKKVMKVKVLDISERPITFTQAVIRSLPQMLPVFISASALISQIQSLTVIDFSNKQFETVLTGAYILYAVLVVGNIISALVTEKKRALHDLIAGTVVVRTNSHQISVTP